MNRPRVERLSPWLFSIGSPLYASTRVFCFPYAGGSANIYRRFAPHAGPDVHLFGVELPGRADRFKELPFTRMSGLMPSLIANIKPHLDVPFAFFGHSMGALIVFELTRELGRRGLPLPLHLFVSGRRAPHLPQRRRLCHGLTDRELIDELRCLGGTPAEALDNSEFMQLMLPLVRADFALCETYACPVGEPVEIPISVLAGTDDPETTREELEAWSLHSKQFAGVTTYPGDHFFLHNQVEELMWTLRTRLRNPQRRSR